MVEPYVVGSEPSDRFPLWTRANVGEVFPDPVAPLTFSLLMPSHTETGWRDAYLKMGAFTADEFTPGKMELLGVFGSYCYLNASVTRILGERMPGLSAQAMDDMWYGSQPGVPPYMEQPGDHNEARTADLAKTLEWAMTVDSLEEPAVSAALVADLRANRPDLHEMSNVELWTHARDLLLTHFRRLFGEHIYITFLSSVPVGALTQICAAVGRESDALKIMSGVGDVASAAPSVAMWRLGRLVAGAPALGAAFDAGLPGLLERLPKAGEAGEQFAREFDAFLYEFGCRGPNEWEPRCHTWETKPELALALIDRMRLAGEDADPELHQKEMASTRERLVSEISDLLAGDPETQGMFLAAARAAIIFQAGRERTKTNAVRLGQEARMALHTLGRRLVTAGLCDEVDDFAFVLADEVDDWLSDPQPLRETVRKRRALYEEYLALQEPFIFVGEIPDPSTWPAKSDPDVTPVRAGDVLTGFPGCAGTATGIARVVLDPLDPTALEPGDILVAPITDPSWTPLFVAAGGVIVDVGAQQSHAMIVSRELGIPCVPSVTGATKRIPNGATVRVDGDSGTVTVLALPPGAAGG